MFKDVLNHMSDAHVYAQAGLVIFVVVFVGTTAWALLAPKGHVRRWSELPLDD